MSEIRFRLAKPSDAKQIASCHWHVRDRYSQGIFLSLGEGFLRAYYKVTLNDPWEVVVCAERSDGVIVGFTSATLDATAQAESLRKHKLTLGLAAIKGLICNPSLIEGVWQRYRSISSSESGQKFVKTDGVRSEYVCWLKDDKNSMMYSVMERVKRQILYDLGVKEYFFEVDKHNEKMLQYHMRVSKAVPVEEITLPDGRVRVLFKRELKRK